MGKWDHWLHLAVRVSRGFSLQHGGQPQARWMLRQRVTGGWGLLGPEAKRQVTRRKMERVGILPEGTTGRGYKLETALGSYIQ